MLRAVPSVRSTVTNISEHLSPVLPLRRFARLLFHFFFEKGDSRIYRFTPGDLMEIERLKAKKYACGVWIYDQAVSVSA